MLNIRVTQICVKLSPTVKFDRYIYNVELLTVNLCLFSYWLDINNYTVYNEAMMILPIF